MIVHAGLPGQVRQSRGHGRGRARVLLATVGLLVFVCLLNPVVGNQAGLKVTDCLDEPVRAVASGSVAIRSNRIREMSYQPMALCSCAFGR